MIAETVRNPVDIKSPLTDGSSSSNGDRVKDMALDEYRKLVRQIMQEVLLDDSNTSRSFTNSGTDHARVVIDVMLDHAQATLNIFSHEMCREVWDPNRIRSIFERNPNAKIRILATADNCTSRDTSALSSLKDLIDREKITLKTVLIPVGMKIPHIAVADGLHTRVETDAEKRQALVSFGNKDLSQSIEVLFEKMWESSH